MTSRMSAEDFRKSTKKGKPRAAGRNAKRTKADGQSFDSKGEARRWAVLKMLEKQGSISNLRRQVTIGLEGRDGPILTPGGRQMIYRADFVYRDGDGREVVEDYKGFANDVYPIKKAILAAQGIKITEVK